MMEKIYFFVAQCDFWLNKDPNSYLSAYFIDEGGFTHAFLIALIVAAAAAALFYGWIGMKVERLANHAVWLGIMAIDAIITFFLTQVMVIGRNATHTGIYHSIQTLLATKSAKIPIDDTVGLANLNQQTNDLITALTDGCEVCNRLYIENVIITVILFVIISFCVKGFTTHTTHIPV